ncbi:MAG: hypothetical protein J2P15_19290, partial [Micromonosporaceae bacterium]|nr:hypothetical protein [Micromonosporaceae bacterium]
MRQIKNIGYAAAGQLLDLYLPDGDGPWPLVLWTKGSGWMADNGRTGADLVARRLREASGGNDPAVAGFAVAGVAVRSTGQARFPAQVEDIQAAIRWLRAAADRYPLDP